MMAGSQPTENRLLPKPGLDDLLRLLADQGYEVIGPRIEQAAIVYAPIQSARDLPIGWTDRQAPGSYRLEKRGDEAYFGYAVGPHSWKKYLFPPTLRLWQVERTAAGIDFRAIEEDPPRRAFLGMRSCELHALAVQDRVFMGRDGRFTDPHYAKARERLFLIAVECEQPGGTCFCASMGTGPDVRPDRMPLLASKHEDGARQARRESTAQIPLPLAPATVPADLAAMPPVCDLVLTELDAAFVIRAVSPAGQKLVDRLGLSAASAEQIADARERVETAARSMGRTVDVTEIRGLLHRNQEHPRWDDVAGRCLACTNCTLVCPTCFCSHAEDVTDLSLQTAEHVRSWDSCFNPEFAGVHGGNFRPSIRGRYRQWLTHKFASWFDQFDVSGCVGCGRCITWCPVGIDVTEEIAAIRGSDGQRGENKA
ncbi:MAG: 4Fe-4S dicluster domain-containing protein [Isosphaeraceae bacterium]